MGRGWSKNVTKLLSSVAPEEIPSQKRNFFSSDEKYDRNIAILDNEDSDGNFFREAQN